MVQRCLFALLIVLAGSAQAAVPVTVAPLAEQLVELEIRAPATVVPANEAVVTAQVTALVREVHADVGATVSKGAVLLSLDNSDARLARDRSNAELQALEAQILQAEARLKRGEDLIRDNYISDDELLDRRTTLAVLRANKVAAEIAVRSAELTLSRTRINAPYDAVVVDRAAQVGSLAQPGMPMITLVQLDDREIEADVDPRSAQGIGSSSALRFETQGRQFSLELARLSPVINANSRVQKARFRFTADAAAIGASGEVVWLDESGLLPVPLIVQRGGRLGVFVAENGKARFQPLPQAQEGRPAQTSLPRDTSLVVRGQARLQDGDELQITRQ